MDIDVVICCVELVRDVNQNEEYDIPDVDLDMDYDM